MRHPVAYLGRSCVLRGSLPGKSAFPWDGYSRLRTRSGMNLALRPHDTDPVSLL
jgi:hypothetical protein